MSAPPIKELERLARVAFEAYAARLATAKTLRMKTPIVKWKDQHPEVRASWLASTRALIREQHTTEKSEAASSLTAWLNSSKEGFGADEIDALFALLYESGE